MRKSTPPTKIRGKYIDRARAAHEPFFGTEWLTLIREVKYTGAVECFKQIRVTGHTKAAVEIALTSS
jgi:hypothetical protein